MAKGWRTHDFDATQREVAAYFEMSQQNVNDAERTGLRKLREEFLKYFTLEEIRSYIRYVEMIGG